MNRTRMLIKLFVCSATLWTIGTGIAWSQASPGTGTLVGLVRERAGDGIPDTVVTLTNESLGFSRLMITTDGGFFHLSELPPATGYKVRIARKGFEDWNSDAFEVPLGRTISLGVTLRHTKTPATPDDGELPAPVMKTMDWSTGLTVERPVLEALPVEEQRLDKLEALAPLTSLTPDGAVAFSGQVASRILILDGMRASTELAGQRAGQRNQVPLEAVQDAQILTLIAPASFGDASGAFVNVASRAGTNTFHGALYDYFRPGGMEAQPRFAMGKDLAQHGHQPGFSLGGPIVRDRLFFFASAEMQDAKYHALNRITNPLIANTNGTGVNSANCTATAAQCETARSFLEQQMNVAVPRSDRLMSGLARLDFRPNDLNFLSLTVNADRNRGDATGTRRVASNGGFLNTGRLVEQARFARLDWTGMLFDRATNNMRVGYAEETIAQTAGSKTALSTKGLGISIYGAQVGANHPWTTNLKEQRFSFADTLSFSLGASAAKVGIEGSQIQDRNSEVVNSTGTYDYTTLTAFAQDLSLAGTKSYTAFTQGFGTAFRSEKTRTFRFFVQDTWRIRPNLTLDLGVRSGMTHRPQPVKIATSYYLTGTIPDQPVNAEPRIGIAYAYTPRTVLRMSYGVVLEPVSSRLIDELFTRNGGYQSMAYVKATQTSAPNFPSVIAAATKIPAGTAGIFYVAGGKLRNAYSSQLSVSIEHRVGKDALVTASYVANPSMRLLVARDVNLANTTKTATYSILNSAGKAVSSYETKMWTAKTDANRGRVFALENGGSAWYKAFVLRVTKPVTHGVHFDATYTYAHAVDDVSGSVEGVPVPVSSANGNYRLDKGTSSADQKHRVVLNWVWQPKVAAGAASHLVNGWAISSSSTLASGLHATPLLVAEGQQYPSLFTTVYTTNINGGNGWSRVPWLPVNSLPLGASYAVNARLARTFRLSEGVQVGAFFESFNLLNSQPTRAVNPIAYYATSGVIRPYSATGTATDSAPGRSCQLGVRFSF